MICILEGRNPNPIPSFNPLSYGSSVAIRQISYSVLVAFFVGEEDGRKEV